MVSGSSEHGRGRDDINRRVPPSLGTMLTMKRVSTSGARPSMPASLAMSMLLGLAAACARPSAPSSAPPPVSEPAPDPDPALPPPEAEPPPPTPGPCADGGRLWDGKPEDCSYEHAGCCYGSAAAACAAAGCSEGQCQVLESYPAQLRCEARDRADVPSAPP
jgi:hypothetical protein